MTATAFGKNPVSGIKRPPGAFYAKMILEYMAAAPERYIDSVLDVAMELGLSAEEFKQAEDYVKYGDWTSIIHYEPNNGIEH
jgi:hypothetical protein